MDSLYLIIFTKIASTEGFLIATALVFLSLFIRGNKNDATLYAVVTIFHLISIVVLKRLFAVPRPPEQLIDVTGYAFPSGHAAGSAFLALSIIFLTWNAPKQLRYPIWTFTILIALLIGLSRLQLEVHTPLQVGVGFLLGILWVVVFLMLRKLLGNKTP